MSKNNSGKIFIRIDMKSGGFISSHLKDMDALGELVNEISTTTERLLCIKDEKDPYDTIFFAANDVRSIEII